jgi:hypothetical protein
LLKDLRNRALANVPIEFHVSKSVKMGHFVRCSLGKGVASGRGVVSALRSDTGQVIVRLVESGTESGWIATQNVASSGVDEMSVLLRAMDASASEVREACATLSQQTRDALDEVRRRVKRDKLPLLSLLQTDPLQMQSSHLCTPRHTPTRRATQCSTSEGTTRLSQPSRSTLRHARCANQARGSRAARRGSGPSGGATHSRLVQRWATCSIAGSCAPLAFGATRWT